MIWLHRRRTPDPSLALRMTSRRVCELSLLHRRHLHRFLTNMPHARFSLRGAEATAVVFIDLVEEVILQAHARLLAEELLCVAVGDALAAVQDRDVVAEIFRVGQDVAG